MEKLKKFTKKELISGASAFINKGYFETTINSVMRNYKGLEIECFYPYELGASETSKYSSIKTKDIEKAFSKKIKELKAFDNTTAWTHSELKKWFVSEYNSEFKDIEKAYRNIYKAVTKGYKMPVILKTYINIFYRKIDNKNLIFCDCNISYVDYMDNEAFLLPSTTIFSNKECKKNVRITIEEIEQNVPKMNEYISNTLSNFMELRKTYNGDFKKAIKELQVYYKQQFEDAEKMRLAMLTK